MPDRRTEFDLIAALRAVLPPAHARVVVGSGDDAAVVRAGGELSVVSVDTTVDGVHARLDLCDPGQAAQDFGWRALTTALSDLAACGAPAGEAYVALTAPRDAPDELLLDIARGIGAAAAEFGVSVIGGDVSQGPAVIASVTVVGWIDGPPLTRAGAQPGDLVGLTGPLGAAGAGLALTLGEVDDAVVAGGSGQPAGEVAARPSEIAAALRQAHLRPWPQMAAGQRLRAVGATAAIDLSDGLVADAGHVAQMSGVRLALDAAAVPLAPGVDRVAIQLGQNPLMFAQSAGEDFQLLVTVPAALRVQAEAAGVTAWIGRVEGAGPEPGAEPVTGLPTDATGRAGHDHRR
jgi:thiamine-monophosphate kinase